MTTTKPVLWIDDEPRRKLTADDLGAQFIGAHGQNLAKIVERLLRRKNTPQLIIIDHVLNKTDSKNPLFQRGSTIAEAIKEQWPACPVVGITAADNYARIDLRTKQTYDELFPFVQFSDYLNHIEAMRKGFALTGRTKVDSARDLIGLLKAPPQEVERLLQAIPEDLSKSVRDASVASRLYSWVKHLLDRPGFLYNGLWAATFVGLNEVGFQKTKKYFEKARYIGVFSSDDEPRWWLSRLSQLLYKQSPPATGEMSWHVGRRLPGVRREHYSRCHRCQKEFPETVAYLDAASNLQRAMHLECTVLHPGFNRELYFEDMRMMKNN